MQFQLRHDRFAVLVHRARSDARSRQALHEYHTAALAAFDDWIKPGTRAFVVRFPASQSIRTAERGG
ncbi:hypothetical protein AW736_12150 [Termitidicoccus mucosus]|uniref:Uncharacterized protein n=1 Tax=Termitidicoccus mucosus TaxID=1184151 RepID=A0A178IK69_9BACT|nr:hypothetical protein AW736_12150 [Opitutaceae bacterium TSB47]